MATLALAGVGASAWAAGKPHEHGVVKADVAVEGGVLTVALEVPMDSLLGFERAPRTEGERKAAAAALARMREGAAIVRPDAAAQCTLDRATVEAPVLEPPPAAAGARPSAAAAANAQEVHADVDVTYTFKCAQPARLQALELALFDALPRLQRVEVQAVFPGGQGRTVLQRPARRVPLTK